MVHKQRNSYSVPAARFGLITVICTVSLACGSGPGQTDNARSAPLPVPEANEIAARNRAIDASRTCTMKLRASITPAGSNAETAQVPPRVEMTIHRKREQDGRVLMLVHFTSPSEQRDRSALVAIGRDGAVQATRYAQSTDAFVTTTDVKGEDSLFGLSLQEMADGQTEKYNFNHASEESVGTSDAYRLEGTLREGADSKFRRLVMLVSKDNFASRGAEFYDAKGTLARRVVIETAEQIDGYWTRMKWSVDNVARARQVDFEVLTASYDQKLDDSIFTREHLKKIASR